MPRLLQKTIYDLFSTEKPFISQNLKKEIRSLSINSSAKSRGATYTRSEVVDFILDLVGYSSDKLVYNKTILEPAFGHGEFLLSIVERLIASWRKHSSIKDIHELEDSVFAVELHLESVQHTKKRLVKKIIEQGIPHHNAKHLVDKWLFQGDFLLEVSNKKYDFVVGNPPYVRQEAVPSLLLKEYRKRYNTMYDRADIYVPFIEKSLSLLNDSGVLGFICNDRWTKNKYGGPLRNLISDDYNLISYIDMVGTNAFSENVGAYPSITILGRSKSENTRVVKNPIIDKKYLSRLACEINGKKLKKDSLVKELSDVVNGADPWLFSPVEKKILLEKLENKYPLLEETGCKVGIGVATGADKVFIDKYDKLDVEQDRKIPIVGTRDVRRGIIDWHGDGVINPFDENGKLVNIENYPKLKRYLLKHKDIIANRYCAKKSPESWYRTIDKIIPLLRYRKKLLVPDIKNKSNIVYDSGKYYPHHNLYYITTEEWDTVALQAVLLSKLSKFFISIYSTKIRGGYLRFQAQHLRRIRLPFWRDVHENIRKELISAGKTRNVEECDRVTYKLYDFNKKEKIIVDDCGE
jgi:hypothetical protein